LIFTFLTTGPSARVRGKGARITHIMNLLHPAPDIQEGILFLPLVFGKHASISERMLRPITAIIDWRRQRKMCEELKSLAQR